MTGVETVPVENLAAPKDAVFSYMTGQMHDSQAALLRAYEAEGEATLRSLTPRLDLPYGPHPRERFDLFTSTAPWAGTLVYFHAGYWQSRDKAQFRFLAADFVAAGIDVAMVNYPLCPDVSLAALTDCARRSLRGILSVQQEQGRGDGALVVAGHSAGGHLAVELALTDWPAFGFVASPVRAVLPISGVYELAPLLETPLNIKLRLDAASAYAASPLHRVKGKLPPALFVAGGVETPAFQAQTQAMAAAWRQGGGVAYTEIVPGEDHFSVLRAFGAGGALFQPVLALCKS